VQSKRRHPAATKGSSGEGGRRSLAMAEAACSLRRGACAPRPRRLAERPVSVPGSALAGGRAVPRRQAPAAQLAGSPEHQLALPLKVAAARVAAAKDRPAEPAGLERARRRLCALGPHCGVRDAYAQLLPPGGRARRAGMPERTQQRGRPASRPRASRSASATWRAPAHATRSCAPGRQVRLPQAKAYGGGVVMQLWCRQQAAGSIIAAL